MKRLTLFVWLILLGLQLEILISHRAFDRPLLGPTEDLFIFIAAAPVQALLLVIWIMRADRSVHEDVKDQICRERISDVGQTSELEEVRGPAIGTLIGTLRDRLMISVRAYRNFGCRIAIIALFLAVLVLLIVAG